MAADLTGAPTVGVGRAIGVEAALGAAVGGAAAQELSDGRAGPRKFAVQGAEPLGVEVQARDVDVIGHRITTDVRPHAEQ